MTAIIILIIRMKSPRILANRVPIFLHDREVGKTTAVTMGFMVQMNIIELIMLIVLLLLLCIHANLQIGRQIDRQIGRKIDGWMERWIYG